MRVNKVLTIIIWLECDWNCNETFCLVPKFKELCWEFQFWEMISNRITIFGLWITMFLCLAVDQMSRRMSKKRPCGWSCSRGLINDCSHAAGERQVDKSTAGCSVRGLCWPLLRHKRCSSVCGEGGAMHGKRFPPKRTKWRAPAQQRPFGVIYRHTLLTRQMRERTLQLQGPSCGVQQTEYINALHHTQIRSIVCSFIILMQQ